MSKLKTSIFGILFFILTHPLALHAASGYRAHLQGTPDNGVVDAGSAAVARDAATALKNPAGMPLLDSSQFMVTMQPLLIWIFWDIDKATTFNGTSGGNSGAAALGTSGFFVYKFTDKLCGGFSYFTPGAISQNYGRDFKGRFFNQRQIVPTISGNWSLGYQVTPKLSFGAGLTIGYAYLNSATAIPDANLFSTLPNRDRVKLNFDNWKRVDLSKLAYGYDVGVMYQFTPCTRMGITFHSQLNFRLHGTVETIITGAGAIYSSGDIVFKIPQFVTVSFYHKLNPCITLLANVGWDNWSILDKSTLRFKDGSKIVTTFNWHDTVSFALGGEYKKSEKLTLQGGISWDSSPVTSKDRNVLLPFSNILYLGAGALYQLNCLETIGLSANYGVSIPRGRSVDEELLGHRFKAKAKVDTAIIALNWNRKI